MGKRFLTAGLLLVMTGCAIQKTSVDANPPFAPHEYRSHDLSVDWQSARQDHVVTVSGTVTTMRYLFAYSFLSLTAQVLDNQGQVIGTNTVYFRDWLQGSAPFHMDIPVAGSPAERVRFTYAFEKEDDVHVLRHFKAAL